MCRPSSPGNNPSRTPTPKGSLASVTVEMGAVAWLNKSTGEYSLREKDGNSNPIDGQIFEDRYGLYTEGLSSCFALAVIGPGGAILAHVPAYFGHGNLPDSQVDERKTMKKNFGALWDANQQHPAPSTVVKIMGGFTDPNNMEHLINQIFPQIASSPFMVAQCARNPIPRKERHGKVVVLAGPDHNEIFVEDEKVL